MEDVFIAYHLDHPFTEIAEIGGAIERAGLFIPGYIPPAVGVLDLRGILYARHFERYEFVILPDRNLVSRMARVQMEGLGSSPDDTTRNAVNVLAFAKATDMHIEPSIAFHELAQHAGNDLAHEELHWFRIADNHDTWEWIEVALGHRSSFSPELSCLVPKPKRQDLSFPLSRWRRNYIVALKIAELELTPLPHVDRALRLIHWLHQDFLLAGPAALFATFYFSPMGMRKRLLKHLRSPDRERAIKGVQNAAWDITHLSDFVRRVSEGEVERRRYIFATSDKGLATIAPLLLKDLDSDANELGLARALEAWWPRKDAQRIVATLADCLSHSDAPDRRNNQPTPSDFIDTLTESGERFLRTVTL